VNLVGIIVGIYYDARTNEHQNYACLVETPNQMMSKFFLIFCGGVLSSSDISYFFDLAQMVAIVFLHEVPGQAMWNL
jgi:hypothetical protein